MTTVLLDSTKAVDYATRWGSSRYFGSSGTTDTLTRVPGGASYKSFVLSGNIPTAGDCYVQCAWQFASNSAPNIVSFLSNIGNYFQISVTRNASTGVVEARLNGASGTLLASGTTPLTAGKWWHIGTHAYIADTGGRVEVWVNGVREINFTGATRAQGAAGQHDIDSLYLGSAQTADRITDIVVCNGTAGGLTGYVGDAYVIPLQPNGNGASSQGAGSDGDSINNYQHVDELPGSATDYVTQNTTGQGDTYAMADLPAGTRQALALWYSAFASRSGGSGTQQLKRRLRIAGTNYTGTARTLTTTPAWLYEVLNVSPATSAAWTPAEIGGLEAGFEAANAASTADLVQLSAVFVEALIPVTAARRGWGTIPIAAGF